MKHLLTLLTFFSAAVGFSQKSEPIGTFWADSTHYVKVSDNNTIEFFSEYGCCLITEVYGIGTYEIKDSILRVTPNTPSTSMSSNHQILNELNQPDKIQITVMDLGEPVKFCNVVIQDKLTQEVLMSASTSDNGFIELTTSKIDINKNVNIKFSSLGMDSYSINLVDVIGRSIKVDLKPFQVIRDEIVEFKIRNEMDSVRLIGPIFPDSEDETMNGKDKLRMVFTNWPWNWNFSYTHAAIPRQFVKK